MYVWLDHSPGRPLTISVLLRPEGGGGGVKMQDFKGYIKTSIKPNWSLKYHNCTTFSIVINYWTSANPLLLSPPKTH